MVSGQYLFHDDCNGARLRKVAGHECCFATGFGDEPDDFGAVGPVAAQSYNRTAFGCQAQASSPADARGTARHKAHFIGEAH